MQKYNQHVSTKKTSQREAILGREDEMAENYAGGVVFKLGGWKMLDRFLILGSCSPTYYASARTMTKENGKNIIGLIKKDAKRVVDRVVEISLAGRAPNNDPALFVLAMVAGLSDDEGKKYALANLSKVARIGTHLFHFVEYVQEFRGWGRGLRSGISAWYLEKETDKLALQVVKYQSRDGWSHRDILRKAHVQAFNSDLNKIFAWVTHGIGGEMKNKDGETVKSFPDTVDDIADIKMIYAFEMAKKAKNEDEIVALINEYRLPREAIPTNFMGKKVYQALLPGMPMTTLIRNLGNLSKNGILVAGNFDDINLVVEKITNEENLRKARVHPFQLLMAMKTYGAGHGMRGKGEWEVVPQIVDALDNAFYKSFSFIEPSGKRILIALDISGSMGMTGWGTSGDVAGIAGFTPREASAAMAMVTMKAEKNWAIVGFSGGYGSYNRGGNRDALITLDLSPTMRLNDVVSKVSNLPFGSTDCSLPAIWAAKNKKDFDAIIILTDNETWSGEIQPVQAMRDYRKAVGHDVKLVVVGMTSTGFSIADPTDSSMLDCVGFDSNAPAIMSDFVSDEL